jgi:hypothetical protein
VALLAAVLLVAACGGREAAPAATAPTAGSTSGATAAPSAPPTAAPAEPTAPAAGGEAPAEQSIPSGKTPEGYNYLGSPDAPVTLQDYSDFL